MKKLLLVSLLVLCLAIPSIALAEAGEVTAVQAEEGQAEEGFVAVLAEDGTVYSQLGVESFSKLIKANGLTDDGSLSKLAVIPDNGNEYPYLYPDGDWKVISFTTAVGGCLLSVGSVHFRPMLTSPLAPGTCFRSATAAGTALLLTGCTLNSSM